MKREGRTVTKTLIRDIAFTKGEDNTLTTVSPQTIGFPMFFKKDRSRTRNVSTINYVDVVKRKQTKKQTKVLQR